MTHLSFLSRCCGGCGAVVCVRCDDFAQAPAVAAAWDAEGWGYAPHTADPRALGGVLCPACLSAPAPPPPSPQAPPQGDLFKER